MEDTENIYIVLSMSGTRFSKFLNIFLRSEFVHVSLSFDEDLKILYSFGRKKINKPWRAGFIEEHIDKGIFGLYNPMCEVLKLEIPKSAYDILVEKIEYVKIHSLEFKYNFSGLAFTFFKIPRRLHRKFTCTQFVATLLDKAGVLEVGKDASLVLPNDYHKLDIECIFKGRMHDYKGGSKGVQ